MEVQANLSRKLPSHQTSLNTSLSGLSLSVARYPDLERTILKPVSRTFTASLHTHAHLRTHTHTRAHIQVLGPLSEDILAYMDQWDGTTIISVTVPSLDMVLSPPTVRLVINSVRSLGSGQVSHHS